MDTQRAREWLETQIETAVQMSGKPPKIAVWGVVLEMPGDVVESLILNGVAYAFAGYRWFDYQSDKTTVCVPIKIKND